MSASGANVPDRYDKPTEEAERVLRDWAFTDAAKDAAAQAFEELAEFKPIAQTPDHLLPSRRDLFYERMEQDRDPFEYYFERPCPWEI